MRALERGWLGAALILAVAWGCASDPDGSSGNGAPSGGLPCNGPTVDCRLAFSGDYTGTFTGADSGSLTFYVNVIGGIDGKATGNKLGTATITGQVSEFGKLEFSTADGVAFTGQFKADHSFSGTWKGAPGNGTFTGGVGGPGGSGGTGGGSNSGDGTLLAEARAACQATLACEGAPPDCSKVEVAPPGCETLELALYQCMKTAKCTFETACQAELDAHVQCVVFGTEPDPGTGYKATGNATYDEATVICEACKAEATACHDLSDCWDYAVCAEACPNSDLYCVDRCWDAHPTGHDAWFDAVTCESDKCPGL